MKTHKKELDQVSVKRQKGTYTPPQLVVHGSFAVLTATTGNQGQSDGGSGSMKRTH